MFNLGIGNALKTEDSWGDYCPYERYYIRFTDGQTMHYTHYTRARIEE